MIIFLKILYAVAVGVGGHQSNPLFNRWESRGRGIWPLLGRYAVGVNMVVVASLPFVEREHRDSAVKIAYTTAACVGTGVLIGYILEDIAEEYNLISNIDV